jgi:hypothetical protein
MNKRVCATLILFGIASIFAAYATAGTIPCYTGTPLTGAINGNVEVAEGQRCDIFDAAVKGNVTVRGVLAAFDSSIKGNLTGDHAEQILLDTVVIGGNFSADDTWSGSNALCTITVGGSVTVKDSGADADWSICDSTIRKNFTFKGNDGGGFIDNNSIGGTFDCHDNNPPPTVGTNTADKNKCQT